MSFMLKAKYLSSLSKRCFLKLNIDREVPSQEVFLLGLLLGHP